MQDGPAERPSVRVLMVTPSYRMVMVNLLDVEAYQRDGFLVVVLDPFTLDDWRMWRDKHPEAA